jgi:integrase
MAYEIDESKYLTELELHQFRARLERSRSLKDKAFLNLVLSTGGRASEVLSIRKADLDPSNKSVKIIGLKGSRDRVLRLNDQVWTLLFDYMNTVAGENIFDFGLRQAYRIWCKYRPVKKKLHCLRHTCAIETYKRTKDLLLVKLVLGHKSLKNTMVYLEHLERKEKLQEFIC